MKTLNVRELRSEMPRLRELLAQEHELLLVSNGETVARILPALRKRRVQPLTVLRAKMPMVKTSIETLLREDRDKR
jgi:antitoxin (DNA-binding transcriptional repressor) of toxin-antitoxin stability system